MTDEYTDAALQRSLAEDSRIAELGIEVTRKGDVIVLCGQVESRERRDAIERRVIEYLGAQSPESPCRLVNELIVVTADPPTQAEDLP
jgi:hypothetical protein